MQPSEKAKEEQVKVIIYFPLDHIPDPNLTIDTKETDHDESIADSQATSSQSRNQSLNDFTFDSSENLGDLFDDVNSPVYTPPILDTTGEPYTGPTRSTIFKTIQPQAMMSNNRDLTRTMSTPL